MKFLKSLPLFILLILPLTADVTLQDYANFIRKRTIVEDFAACMKLEGSPSQLEVLDSFDKLSPKDKSFCMIHYVAQLQERFQFIRSQSPVTDASTVLANKCVIIANQAHEIASPFFDNQNGNLVMLAPFSDEVSVQYEKLAANLHQQLINYVDHLHPYKAEL